MSLFLLLCAALEVIACLGDIAIQNAADTGIYSIQFYLQGHDGTSCGDGINNVQIWNKQQNAWVDRSGVWYNADNQGDKYQFDCQGVSGCEYTLPVSILLSTVNGNPITLTNVIQSYDPSNWVSSTCQLCRGTQTCYFPTPSPTSLPTSSPTNHPSTSPSDHPTSSPSDHPSSSPTNNPTVSPTKHPVPSSAVVASGDPTTSPSAHSQEVSAPTQAPSYLGHKAEHNEETSPSVGDEVMAALFAVIGVLGVFACVLLMIYGRRRMQQIHDARSKKAKREKEEIEVNGRPAAESHNMQRVRSSVNDESKEEQVLRVPSAVIVYQKDDPQEFAYERKESEPGQVDENVRGINLKKEMEQNDENEKATHEGSISSKSSEGLGMYKRGTKQATYGSPTGRPNEV